MANITQQNFITYLSSSVGSRNKTYYAQGGFPSVNAFYGTYDSTDTAHKTLCAAYGDFENLSEITKNTPCSQIPQGFTVAVDIDGSVVEYQYKKAMPEGGYTANDLEKKIETKSDVETEFSNYVKSTSFCEDFNQNQDNDYISESCIDDSDLQMEERLDGGSTKKFLKFADRNNDGNMGYVILRTNKSFNQQVNKSNTIYEIRHAFQVIGSDFILPDNCILYFNGGSISGIINGSIDVRGEYDGKFNVYIPTGENNVIITKDYHLFNYGNTNSRSQLEACRNGVIIYENINVSLGEGIYNGVNLYTSVRGKNREVKIQHDPEKNATINIAADNVTVSNITIEKLMQYTEVYDSEGDYIPKTLGVWLAIKGNRSNMTIENCIIYGGMQFTRRETEDATSDNLRITNCQIYADYSLIQDSPVLRWKLQKDVMTFQGYTNIRVENNIVWYKDVNRCIKSAIRNGQVPHDIWVINNTFTSSVSDDRYYIMKQFWDAYSYSGNIHLCNNNLNIPNHTRVFEQKTQTMAARYDSPTQIEIAGNIGKISGGMAYTYNIGDYIDINIHDNNIDIISPILPTAAGVTPDSSFKPYNILYIASSKVSVHNNHFRITRNDMANTSAMIFRKVALTNGNSEYYVADNIAECYINDNIIDGVSAIGGIRVENTKYISFHNNYLTALSSDKYAYTLLNVNKAIIQTLCDKGKGLVELKSNYDGELSIDARNRNKDSVLIYGSYTANAKIKILSPWYRKNIESKTYFADIELSELKSLTNITEDGGFRQKGGWLYMCSNGAWTKIKEIQTETFTSTITITCSESVSDAFVINHTNDSGYSQTGTIVQLSAGENIINNVNNFIFLDTATPITAINIENFVPSTNYSSRGLSKTSISTVFVGDTDFSQLIKSDSMFSSYNGEITGTFSDFSNCISMRTMFNNCTIPQIDFSLVDLSANKDFTSMFANSNIEKLIMGDVTINRDKTSSMFANCNIDEFICDSWTFGVEGSTFSAMFSRSKFGTFKINSISNSYFEDTLRPLMPNIADADIEKIPIETNSDDEDEGGDTSDVFCVIMHYNQFTPFRNNELE